MTDLTAYTTQELAAYFTEYFETRTRDNGNNFLVTKDGAPDELKDLIQSAHGGHLPNDGDYQTIHDALIAISEADDLEEVELEVDCAYFSRLQWLQDYPSERIELVDEVADEFETYPGLDELLGRAIYRYQQNIVAVVLDSLQSFF